MPPMRGRPLMGTAIDYLDTWAVALFAFFTGDVMVEFFSNIRPAMVGCVDVGFSVIIDERVNIRVMGYLKIFVHTMFMPD